MINIDVMKFTQYRRSQVAEMVAWEPGLDMADYFADNFEPL